MFFYASTITSACLTATKPSMDTSRSRKRAGDMSRHVSIAGMSFFIISFFYLLITFFTGSTNVLLCVDYHLGTSNSYQTEHGHEQEQETGWRHVKTGRLWRCKGRVWRSMGGTLRGPNDETMFRCLGPGVFYF